jgi:hypothetical protein
LASIGFDLALLILRRMWDWIAFFLFVFDFVWFDLLFGDLDLVVILILILFGLICSLVIWIWL